VDSAALTIAQAKRMHDALAPTLGYLTRLQQRMDRVGFESATQAAGTGTVSGVPEVSSSIIVFSPDPLGTGLR